MLALGLEALTILEGEAGGATSSLADISDEGVEFWAVNLEATVVSHDLTSWASDLLAGGLSLGNLLGVSDWALGLDAKTVLEDLSVGALLHIDNGFSVASALDLLEAWLADNLWLADGLSDASLTVEGESSWAGEHAGGVGFDALVVLLGPAGWAILHAALVLVVGVAFWAGVGGFPLGLPLGLLVLPGVDVSLDNLTVTFLDVVPLGDGLFVQGLPLRVVLDDVLDAEVVPFGVLLHPGLEPFDVGDLSLLGPVGLGHRLLSDDLVHSNHSLGGPPAHGVGVVEFDVGDLLGGGPISVVGGPLDESSVLGVLVLVDVLDVHLLDVLVLVDGSEVTHGDSPALEGPLALVTDDSLSLDHLVELGVPDSLLDDSVVLSVSDDSVALSDGDVLGLLLDDSSDLDQSDSSGLALDDGGGVLDSVLPPLSALGHSSDDLVSVAGLVGVSESLHDLPLLLASDGSQLANASPLLSVDGLHA